MINLDIINQNQNDQKGVITGKRFDKRLQNSLGYVDKIQGNSCHMWGKVAAEKGINAVHQATNRLPETPGGLKEN